jgi:outer membrane receptor protein involved in Fe transport
MKRIRHLIIAAAAAWAASVQPLAAQTAPTSGGGGEEAVKLDPFSVSADSDVGFVAASSLAGGRIATALKDTPVAYTVITKEFIDAFNVTDVVEAAQWSTNTNQNEGDGGTRMYGNSSATMVRMRGIKMGLPTRNFFTISRTADSYNVDRVDMARGPNSVLFGAGGVAGTMNSMTKQAEPSRRFAEVQLRLGSFERHRFTADINQPLNDKIALRANFLYDEGGTWRQHEWNEKRALTLAAKYNITSKLTLRAEVEYFKNLDGTMSASIRDNLSAWDGQTTFASYPSNGATVPMTAAALAAAGLQIIPQRFVESSAWGHTYLNFQNRYATKGVQQNNTLANTNRINGVPVRTVGFNLNRQALIDAEDGVPGDRWNRAIGGSPFWNLPSREDTTIWTNRSLPLATAKGGDASLYLNYTPTDQLYFEVAATASTSKQFGENTQRRGLLDLYMDVNRTLSDGTPNPTFLKPYIDVFNYRTHRNYDIQQVRTQAIYKKETRIGRLQFSGIVGMNVQKLEAKGQSMLLPMTSLAQDARSWTDVSEFSEYGAYTRYTFNDGSSRVWRDNSNAFVTTYNPQNGIREVVQPAFMYDTKRQENNYVGWQRFKFFQTAGNFDLFKNRVVLIGAFRRDFTSIYTRRVMFPGDNAAGWDGTTRAWKPDAPADYYSLTYQTKDATGKVTGPAVLPATSRPRGRTSTNANIGFAQYANDRFQDDYSAPVYKSNVNTWTYGTVVNVARWLGVYANKSSTFNLSLPAQRVDGSLVPPTSSEGTDYGIRVTLPGNRLAVSIGRYDSFQEGATIRAALGGYSTIAAAPVVGDLTTTGRNIRGFRQLPQDVFTTLTDSTKGWEFEATANLSPAWRLILNVGYTDAVQRDQQPDVIKWIPQQDSVMRQILADSGVVIDASNDARIPDAINDPTKINITKVQAAVDAWNTLQDVTIPGLTGQVPRATGGMTKWTGNLATDYRIRTGPLRGLRVGGGAQYRSGQVIGFKAGDTIRDPSNPNAAIDDPTVDGTSPIFAAGYLKAVASMSYTVRLKESGRRIVPKSIQFDFNVDNLLDEQDVIYGNINDTVQTGVTLFRPRVGEDITSPARRTVPGNFGYIAPRSYTLSAKLNF